MRPLCVNELLSWGPTTDKRVTPAISAQMSLGDRGCPKGFHYERQTSSTLPDSPNLPPPSHEFRESIHHPVSTQDICPSWPLHLRCPSQGTPLTTFGSPGVSSQRGRSGPPYLNSPSTPQPVPLVSSLLKVSDNHLSLQLEKEPQGRPLVCFTQKWHPLEACLAQNGCSRTICEWVS